ncbi:hypothetical protein LJR230_004772 [Trinickia sp. LjRoot230]|uniref:hypothetical protein n=1 Tax=Trinickia sp. LjRoot230 TaxID=3342288 RepID=UPI003ED03E00
MKTARTRKWLTAAFVIGAFVPALVPAAQADVGQAAHDFKENAKAAGKHIGSDAREAAHATAETSKKFGHAVAQGARNGYHATKDAIHRTVSKSKSDSHEPASNGTAQ